MLAAAISGRFVPNFCSRNSIVGSIERPYSHDISPSAEHVLRALGLRGVTPSISFSAPTVSDRERHRVHLVLVERAVLERVLLVAGLLEVPLGEGVGVDDQRAALRQVGDVRLQRGRVHRDEDVRRVARREDVVVGEVELEAGDAGQRAGGRADLGGEVGQRRDVVAEQRGLGR